MPESTVYLAARCSAVVPDTTLNRDAWKDGFRLIVGSEMYAVVHNPPTVDKVTMSQTIL